MQTGDFSAAAIAQIPPDTSGTFWLYAGFDRDGDGDIVQDAEYTHYGTIAVGAAAIDVDVDSDNTNGYALPDGSTIEDRIESTAGSVGKVLFVDDARVPVVLKAPWPLTVDSADVRITYNAAAVGDDSTGALRLWTDATGGSVVGSGVHSAAMLGLSDQQRSVVLWVEGVNTTAGGAASLLIEFDEDGVAGPANYEFSDEVFLTVRPADQAPARGGVDLQVAGVAQSTEHHIGGFIALNRDHDEGNTDPNGRPLADHEIDAAAGHRIVANDDELLDATLDLQGDGGVWRLHYGEQVETWMEVDDQPGVYQRIIRGQDYAFDEAGQVQLKIEALGGSSSLRLIELVAEVEPTGGVLSHDTVVLTAIGIDLDIDADDDDGKDRPELDREEDDLEDHADQPGKALVVGASGLTPLVLYVSAPGDVVNTSTITLSYDASDPSESTPTSSLRIYSHNDRTGYLAPGTYDANALGLGPNQSEITLWVEAVDFAATDAERVIEVSIDSDGAGASGVVATDRIHVTPVAAAASGDVTGYVWNDLDADAVRDAELELVPGNPPDAVYIIDVSGSTIENHYRGTQVGDVNLDGLANTVLDGELQAFLDLTGSLIDAGLGSQTEVGIVVFARGPLWSMPTPTCKAYSSPQPWAASGTARSWTYSAQFNMPSMAWGARRTSGPRSRKRSMSPRRFRATATRPRHCSCPMATPTPTIGRRPTSATPRHSKTPTA